MADPLNFLVVYVAFIVLVIIGFFAGAETAVAVAAAMFLIGFGLFLSGRTRIILIIVGLAWTGLLVSAIVGIGQAVITIGTIIQIFGFLSMVYSQNLLLRPKDKELFHQIFEQIVEKTPPQVQGAPIARYWISGIWFVVAGLFLQLTGMFLLKI